MKNTAITTLLTCLLATVSVHATQPGLPFEKIPLTHDVYDNWKAIIRPQISNDGRIASWEINPQQGDRWLYLLDLKDDNLFTVARGNRAVFSPNSDYVAYYINPPTAVVRQAKLDGRSPDEMPGDSVGIYVFGHISNSSTTAESFAVAAEESSWMVYQTKRKPFTAEPGTTGTPQTGQGTSRQAGQGAARQGSQGAVHQESQGAVRQAGRPPAPAGTLMAIFNPITIEKHEFEDVVEFALSRNGALVGFVRQKDSAADNITVQVFNTVKQTGQTIFEGPGASKRITVSRDGRQVAFLHSADTAGTKVFDLYHWQEGWEAASRAVYAGADGIPEGWTIIDNTSPVFSGNGSRIFFGTAPEPEPEPEDPLLPEEKYRLDIWHYRDLKIQPQQLVEARRDGRVSYTAVYHVEEGRTVQLATPQVPEVTTTQAGDGNYEMGTSTLPYQIQNSFESGEYRDVYLIDVNTGEQMLLLEKHRGSVHLSTLGDARLSTGGKYLIYFSQADSNWYSISIADAVSNFTGSAAQSPGSTTSRIPEGTTTSRNITAGIPRPLYYELHDTPSSPGPYGIAGWVGDDSYVLIYDRFDIWKVDPAGKEDPVCMTNGYGRANNIQLHYVEPVNEPGHIGSREEIMLSAFDFQTKQSGFYSVRVNRPGNPSRRIMDDARFFLPVKAKNADVLIWQKSTFTQYPDLWTSNSRFRNPERISSANPQQIKYKWGTARLVDWVSFSSDTIQGVLYLPENLDPGKKYPMIVYFYERLSQNLHNHFVPAPSRSTINISWCVSNDYIVFVPDIPYTVGSPGRSVYNAVVSGTNAMINRFDFIDRHNIGLQGQSWAGYQIAYLITQTGMFRAAMAGAPVTNMTSAYGGIRWATGLSRIYQYEETQSRIGGTPWDQTLRYIENSPVFFADRITTPLLMMHNDADGAVPWYQGIELYMVLRRLGKPVWMLNYNGEAHNLTRRPNMMDFTIRLYQFFDHFLKGEPAPEWLKYGIPATMKGKTDGYGLTGF